MILKRGWSSTSSALCWEFHWQHISWQYLRHILCDVHIQSSWKVTFTLFAMIMQYISDHTATVIGYRTVKALILSYTCMYKANAWLTFKGKQFAIMYIHACHGRQPHFVQCINSARRGIVIDHYYPPPHVKQGSSDQSWYKTSSRMLSQYSWYSKYSHRNHMNTLLLYNVLIGHGNYNSTDTIMSTCEVCIWTGQRS